MMTSSHDELMSGRRRPAVSVEHLTRRPRQAHRAGRRHRAHRPRHHHRRARPIRMRQDHVDPQHRRNAGHRIGIRHRARATGGIRRAAAPRRLRHPGPHDLRGPPRRRQRALLRLAVRHPTRKPPRTRSPTSDSTITERRCAATCPAASAPGSRWRARWWRTPICWCSTNRPSGSTRFCGSTCGSSSDHLARRGTTLMVSSHVMDEADHCGDLLLLREGRLLAHTTPTKLREDTGCQSLEEAFLSVIRHSTAPALG